MAKKRVKKNRKIQLDPGEFLHQPHDKYVRFVMQSKEMALALLGFCMPSECFASIDWEKFDLSDDSFIDERLQAHFSDIVYVSQTKQQKPLRIAIIFEHKSDKPEGFLLEQLNRYITNIWSNDIRQGRSLSLTIPVVIYHGHSRLEKETPAVMFPDAPESLLRYVPFFDYTILDVGNIPDAVLETFEFILFRNFLLALKYGRDDQFMLENWEKIAIFAPSVLRDRLHLEIYRATFYYLDFVSKVFNQKVSNMKHIVFTTEEGTFITNESGTYKPVVMEVYEKGMERGMEKGMEKILAAFIKQFPDWPDEQIALSLNISLNLVQKVRKNTGE